MKISSSDPDFVKDVLRIITNNQNTLIENSNLKQENKLLKEWLKAYKESLEIILSKGL